MWLTIHFSKEIKTKLTLTKLTVTTLKKIQLTPKKMPIESLSILWFHFVLKWTFHKLLLQYMQQFHSILVLLKKGLGKMFDPWTWPLLASLYSNSLRDLILIHSVHTCVASSKLSSIECDGRSLSECTVLKNWKSAILGIFFF